LEPNDTHCFNRFLIIQANRLFAVDGFTRLSRSFQVIDMGVRRRADEHGIDLLALEYFRGVSHRLGARRGCQLSGRFQVDIAYRYQFRGRMTSNVLGLDGTNETGSDHCHFKHIIVLFLR
jgi:hypothetical protein